MPMTRVLRHDDRMIARILIILAALMALPHAAFAQTTAEPALQNVEGSWALRIHNATIFTFDIERGDDGGWRTSWTRPASFRSNGVVFTAMSGSETIEAMTVRELADGVELHFEDPRPGAVPDVFHIRPKSVSQAELVYVGTLFAPYPLVRVRAGTPLGPFDATRIYDRDDAVTEGDYVAADNTQSAAPAPAISTTPSLAPQLSDDAEGPNEGLSASFLDDLAVTPETAAQMQDDSGREAPVQPASLACSDFTRVDPPSLAELEARWGNDYESIGTGLDIREYRMDNGDIARITMLDERVYINGCG